MTISELLPLNPLMARAVGNDDIEAVRRITSLEAAQRFIEDYFAAARNSTDELFLGSFALTPFGFSGKLMLHEEASVAWLQIADMLNLAYEWRARLQESKSGKRPLTLDELQSMGFSWEPKTHRLSPKTNETLELIAVRAFVPMGDGPYTSYLAEAVKRSPGVRERFPYAEVIGPNEEGEYVLQLEAGMFHARQFKKMKNYVECLETALDCLFTINLEGVAFVSKGCTPQPVFSSLVCALWWRLCELWSQYDVLRCAQCGALFTPTAKARGNARVFCSTPCREHNKYLRRKKAASESTDTNSDAGPSGLE